MTSKDFVNEIKKLLGMEISDEVAPVIPEATIEAAEVPVEAPVEPEKPEEEKPEEPKIEEKVAQLEERISKLEEAIIMITENYSKMDTKFSSDIEKIANTPLANPTFTQVETKPLSIAEMRMKAIDDLKKNNIADIKGDVK